MKRIEQLTKWLKKTVAERKLTPIAVLTGIVLMIGWLAFFDSHSVMKRVVWYQELSNIQEENAILEARIADLEAQLEAGLSDELVEQLAREEYGMRRDGEQVYPVLNPNE